MGYVLLTTDQIRHLNEIYISIVKKYRNNATHNVLIQSPPQITSEDAERLADLELGERRIKIMHTYQDRVDNINRNAIARRIVNSSVICQLLDRAYERKNDALTRLEDMKERLKKKILSENQRATLAVEREKAVTRSRSLRDFIAVSRMRISVPYNAQTLIDEELYNAYLAWAMQFPPRLANSYVNHNELFMINMGMTMWLRLIAELNNRAMGTP